MNVYFHKRPLSECKKLCTSIVPKFWNFWIQKKPWYQWRSGILLQILNIEKAVNAIDDESDGDDNYPVDDTQGEKTADAPIISGQYPESQLFDTIHDGSVM